MPKKESKAERAREMPLTDKQAEAAIQALRDDAGSAAYRKRLQEKKPKGEEPVKKKNMNMGGATTARLGNPPPSRRMAQTPIMPVPQATPTAPILPANPIPRPKPPGMSKGGKIRGYGMARGGKACKMM
jgi:hypothetical protein